MRRIAVGVLGALMLWPVMAIAQTHPCDTPPPTTFREPNAQLGNLRVGFCHDGKDTNGNPIETAITFSLTVGTNAPIDLGQLTPQGPPNAQGFSYYTFQTQSLAAGTLHMNATALGMESADSASITLTLLGPPKPPKDPRIDKIGGVN